MAKAIKFNLILNKQAVRDLEDLREHFNIEDLLAAFNNGSLQRWLQVRGLTTALEKIRTLPKDDLPAVAVGLCAVFHGFLSQEDSEAAAYIFTLREKERQELLRYKSLAEQRDNIITRYHAEYDKLLSDMEEKCDDYPFLKASIQGIFQHYRGLFQLNAADFYDRFVFDYPLVIFSIMAHQDMKALVTCVKSQDQIFEDLTDGDRRIASFKQRYGANKPIPFQKTCRNEAELKALQDRAKRVFVLGTVDRIELALRNTSELKTTPVYYIETDLTYPPHIKIWFENTDGHFTHLEPAGKRCMIIKMGSGIVSKRDGSKADELQAGDVNGKFVILDGVDYSGKNDKDSLIYMEI